MSVQKAYNNWASQYDTNVNRTRDLEAIALRETLSTIDFKSVLEAGCGTGKNTEWFINKADQVTAIDLSEEMLAKARQKIHSPKVEFRQVNLMEPWTFRTRLYDLVSYSLVLEHIENLSPIFASTAEALKTGGYVYIGELHPFKQYSGSKARFETESGVEVVECYNHNISDFVRGGRENGLQLVHLEEYFDDDNSNGLPRVLSLLLQKA